MKKFTLLIFTLFALVATSACDKKQKDNGIPDWPWEKPDEPATDWTDVTKDYAGLPEYIQIFKAPSKLLDVDAVAYIASVDLTKQGFEVWGLDAPTLNGSDEPLQTPSQVYEAQGKPSIVINAGYFYTASGKSYSSSLEVSNGKLLSPNINYASKDWVTMYYPTRGAFIEHKDGTYEVGWTYWSDKAHYIYDVPAQNSWDAKPLQVPNESFPSKGKVFEAENAIGGAPVLIKNGVIKDTYKEELIDIMADERHPRTAIGITKDKKLVLFVCEGRDMTEGVPGYTTGEVANILLEYGCIDALNLDGGGSTLMLVNGKEMLKPSDGHQRSVGSCVYIK